MLMDAHLREGVYLKCLREHFESRYTSNFDLTKIQANFHRKSIILNKAKGTLAPERG